MFPDPFSGLLKKIFIEILKHMECKWMAVELVNPKIWQ